MATTNTYHTRMNTVDSSSNVNIIYPQTYAKDAVVETSGATYLSSNNLSNLQLLANKVGADMASIISQVNSLSETIE